MSGTLAQMAASHPSQIYQVPGGSGSAYEPASENAKSTPLPLAGGRRRRHTKKGGRRHPKKTAKRHHRKSRK
jgi:hypothetical protein